MQIYVALLVPTPFYRLLTNGIEYGQKGEWSYFDVAIFIKPDDMENMKCKGKIGKI